MAFFGSGLPSGSGNSGIVGSGLPNGSAGVGVGRNGLPFGNPAIGYGDPATSSNMLQAVHLDAQSGTMKTVSQFLTSPQPIVPVMQAYDPYPHSLVAGSPAPLTPASRVALWDQAKVSIMGLRTLFAKPRGSISQQ